MKRDNNPQSFRNIVFSQDEITVDGAISTEHRSFYTHFDIHLIHILERISCTRNSEIDGKERPEIKWQVKFPMKSSNLLPKQFFQKLAQKEL